VSAGYVIAGRRLPYGDLRQIQVRDQIKVEHWLRNEGREFTDARNWDDLVAIGAEIQSQPDAEAQQQNPEFKFFLSVAIWAAMRLDGDKVDLGDVLGLFTWDDLTFYSDEDEPEGKAPAA
jgi:hypothetical protein